jgi:hypothetical protein
MARFDDVARELQTLIDQPGWSVDDKALLNARIHALLAAVSAPEQHVQDDVDDDFPDDFQDDFQDDIETATEAQLFAILDEEVGP